MKILEPMINDVVTDLSDPPRYLRGAHGPYPKTFSAAMKRHYDDLVPLELPMTADDAYQLALEVAQSTGDWELTIVEPAERAIEGTASSRYSREPDDFAIRVRENAVGRAVLDMRSTSRTGRGDQGTNAARIRNYFAAVRRAAGV